MVTKQNFEQAAIYYKEAIMLDSCYADAWNNLGALQSLTKHPNEAIDSYSRALACNVDFLPARIGRASAYFDQRDYLKAVADARSVLQLRDTSVAYFVMGMALSRMRSYDSALMAFDAACRLSPSDAECLVNRGVVLYQMQRYNEATLQLEQARILAPKTAPVYIALGMIASDRKQYERALSWYEDALRVNPSDPVALNNRGFVYLQLDSLPRALSDIDNSIVRMPENAWAYRNKGIYYLKAGEPESALRVLLQAESLDPHTPQVRALLATTFARMHDAGKACEYLAKARSVGDTYFEGENFTFCP
jgi:tetratricopeptide (TPR) repeat protein